MHDHRPIRFCPLCGTPVKLAERFGRPRPTCPECGWIYVEDPKVAVAVLVRQNEKVLLVQRANPPQQGLWALPAGFVDAREDPLRAAERECAEETGLCVRVTGLLSVFTGRESEHSADIVLLYGAEILSGSLQAGDDAQQAAFFAPNELPPLAFRSTRQALGLESSFSPNGS
jgi:ADP-ribose pyrophosphatase YjhB (NUDIX family)